MVKYVMAWIELHISTTAKYADGIGEQLNSFGAQALTMKDAGDRPIYEPALNRTPAVWPETIIVGLFDDQENLQPVVTYLEKLQNAGNIKHFEQQPLPDEDWERRCLDSFVPIRCGKRLWICPSWQTPPEPDAVNVILDPGLAFGTGTHPTTFLCLEWLDANIKGGETVIDYGCGSGILAVAALKLGATYAAGVDHDPEALKASRENAEVNFLTAKQLEISLPESFKSPEVDLVIANILAKPLIEFAPMLANYVKTGGRILLSGILFEQSEAVSAVYTQWFEMQPAVFKEEWSCLSGIKR
jgi:ribosomal protein L11 methyltransferase